MKRLATLILLLGLNTCMAQTYRWENVGGGVGKPVVGERASTLLNDTINNLLYVGGNFVTSDDSIDCNGIARWDGSKWSVNFIYFGWGAPDITSLVLFQGTIFGSTSAGEIFHYDGSDWKPIGIADNSVLSLCVYHDKLYAGGDFKNVNGVSAKHIACYDGTAWSSVSGGLIWSTSLGTVNAMTVWQDKLYAVGDFDFAGNSSGMVKVNSIACWDDSSWTGLGNGAWIGGSGSHMAYVNAVCVHNDSLYIGGRIDTAGNIPAKNVAMWNGYEWKAVGKGLNSDVRALRSFDKKLCAGGDFSFRFQTWDGINWIHSAETEPENSVIAMEEFENTLYIGGLFCIAAGDEAKHVAKFVDVTSTNPTLSSSQLTLTLYPNPVTSQLTVNMEQLTGEAEIELRDIYGRLIKQIKITLSPTVIDVKPLKNGVFFLYLKTRDGVMTGKFVKQ